MEPQCPPVLWPVTGSTSTVPGRAVQSRGEPRRPGARASARASDESVKTRSGKCISPVVCHSRGTLKHSFLFRVFVPRHRRGSRRGRSCCTAPGRRGTPLRPPGRRSAAPRPGPHGFSLEWNVTSRSAVHFTTCCLAFRPVLRSPLCPRGEKSRKIAYDFYLRATEVREVRKIAGVALSLKSGLRLPGPIFFGKFSGPRWVGCAGVAGKQSKAKGKPEP